MKRKLLFLLTLVLILSLAVFVACNDNENGNDNDIDNKDDTPVVEHKSNGTYSFDDVYHWFGCTGCSEHKYDEAKHSFVDNVANKKCSVCNKEVDFTQEENALVWIAGRNATNEYTGKFSLSFIEEVVDSMKDSKNSQKQQFTESWDGQSKYFFDVKQYVAKNNEDYALSSSKLELVKTVSENGGDVLKYFEDELQADGQRNVIEGEIEAGNIYLHYQPNKQIDDDCGGVADGNDYATLIESMDSWAENECMNIESIDFIRNSDGSVTLKIAAVVAQEGEDEDTGDKFEGKYEFVAKYTVKDGKIVRIIEENIESYVFENTEKNRTSKSLRDKTYSYDFNQEYYDAIEIKRAEE